MTTNRKVAVITGSHKGLGIAIARKLALLDDVWVIITSRKESDSKATEQKLKAEGIEVDRHQLDVSDTESVTKFIEWVTSAYGRVDILVNNAGVNPSNVSEEASILTAKPETMLDTFTTNTIGALRMCQAVIPLMQQRDYGRIVNVSTEMASLQQIPQDFYPIAPSYRISKVGLNAMTTLLAKELKNTNILVNNYSPGWMQTDMGGRDAPYTTEEGAETAIYLATLPDGSSQGGFFAETRKFGGAVALPW
ncbi:Short-chain dehydrogenase/reductase SDR [Hyella patelloides LEGE 07179]|uniref:Short-chain dehydrogenase/reductase SDR n=1 Tax=Hyella patelloides LEGE 07179 TaxID=945734 RepID=A0A563W1L6_9CYAN|nr:SDR family NAD(P)-dependent oxidoreductase [Hyella patelloides]VEP17599.1 Short-chain dehydrogenase/reductase SDR [Hyella patelloides LEGE 07179]